jgi:hypothetical protein
MKSSEQINELATALSQAQAEFPTVAKSADNPFFKSKYANLASIIETVKPILGKYGLSVVQIPATDVERKLLVMETVLLHKSGQYISGEFALPVLDWKPQGMGSATTYAQRYSAAPMLFVASDKDDDDGNHASGRESKDNEFAPKPKSPQSSTNAVKSAPTASVNAAQAPTTEAASPELVRSPSCLTASQVKTFWADCKKMGASESDVREVLGQFGMESTKEIKISQLNEVLQAVRDRVIPREIIHG